MKVALPSLMATVVALGAWAPGVSGQLWEAAPVGEEYVSVALVGGVVSPGTTYADGSSLSSGTALGLRSTYWFKRYFGVGAGVTRSTNDADVGGATAGFSALVGQDPTVYLWGVHATLRYPMEMGGLAWFPYLSGGPTAKAYHWAGFEPLNGGLFGRPYGGSRNTSFGWSYGGGAEVRLSGMFGVTVDLRRNQSDFDWFGLRSSQKDWLITGGLTIVR
jgi:opacity protein-like surface antigen